MYLFSSVCFHDRLCSMKCRHCVQPYTDSPRGLWDTLHWRRRLGGQHVAAVFFYSPLTGGQTRLGIFGLHSLSSVPEGSVLQIAANTETWGQFRSVWLFQPQFISPCGKNRNENIPHSDSDVVQEMKWNACCVDKSIGLYHVLLNPFSRKQFKRFVSFQSKHVMLCNSNVPQKCL